MNEFVGGWRTFSGADDSEKIGVTVVVPTYNEADNLASFCRALSTLPISGLRLLIVDDNSPDGTGVLADELALQYDRFDDRSRSMRIEVIHRSEKSGLGSAYIAGMKKAIGDGAEYIVQMDADFSHSPEYIPKMTGVLRAADADVVVGSRYVPGGTLDVEWPRRRRFVSWWANFYSRSILGLRTRDMTSGFKLWTRQALVDLDLGRIRSAGYSFQVEMAFLSEKLGFHIVEIPIHFRERHLGESKLDLGVKLESAWRLWEFRFRYRNVAVVERRLGDKDFRPT